MTRNVQKGPSVAIAHHFNTFAHPNSVAPAISAQVPGRPRMAPSANMVRNAAGYARRIAWYTSPLASIPPRRRCARSFLEARRASMSIRPNTTKKTAAVMTPFSLGTHHGGREGRGGEILPFHCARELSRAASRDDAVRGTASFVEG